MIALTLGLGALPLFLSQEMNEKVVTSANLVGSLSSIVTLVLAILLFKKYGIEQSLLNKQTEAVFQLLAEIKKTRLILIPTEGGFIQLFLGDMKEEYWSLAKDCKLRFSINYADNLSAIWNIAEDVFLPEEVALKLRPLMVSIIQPSASDKGYLDVIVPPHKKEIDEKDFFGIMNRNEITLEEFVRNWQDVLRAAKGWLNNHADIPFKLNILV